MRRFYPHTPTRPARCRSVCGFSLVELMVTIAIMAIGLSIAAPSFSRMIAEQRVRSAASELHTALLYARSAAITRNEPVVLEPKTAGDWTKGWKIAPAAASTEVLRETGDLKNVTVSDAPAGVTFRANGRPTVTVPTITLTSSSESTVKRCITTSPSGQATVGAC